MADPARVPVPGDEPLLSQWRAVLQQMPAGVILARAPDGRVIFANEAAESIWRQSAADTNSVGAYARWRGFHPDGRPYRPEEWPLARALRTGETVSGEEIDIERGDGSRGAVSVNAAPIRDPAGAVVAAVVTFTDVTQRRREESARRFLAAAGAVLSSSLDYPATLANVARLAVPTLADWCAVDIVREGKLRRLAVEHVDPRKAALVREVYQRLTGEPREDSGLAAMMGAGKPQLLPEITDAMLVTIASDREHLRVLRELGLRSAMVLPLVARGRVLGGIVLVAAESGRTFGAEELALAEELTSLAALAIDNARLYEESQSANQAKADFLSVISHELRTPLTAVIGYAELLALGIPEPVTERQHEHVERIEVAARHLLQLIEEILTAASLDAGTIRMQRQPAELGEILERAHAIIAPLALDRQLDLTMEPLPGPIPLVTDPDRLLQVFLNLLSNAVKFTDEGWIRVSTRRGEASVEVDIRDSGMGITPAQLERIFEPFWQAEQPITRRTGGTGLGLTISRRLLDLLGGEMRVRSEPGQGSTFTVRIPLGEPRNP